MSEDATLYETWTARIVSVLTLIAMIGPAFFPVGWFYQFMQPHLMGGDTLAIVLLGPYIFGIIAIFVASIVIPAFFAGVAVDETIKSIRA